MFINTSEFIVYDCHTLIYWVPIAKVHGLISLQICFHKVFSSIFKQLFTLHIAFHLAFVTTADTALPINILLILEIPIESTKVKSMLSFVGSLKTPTELTAIKDLDNRENNL